MLGLQLAIHNPNRLEKLAVSNTGAKIGTAESWNERIKTVRRRGMAKVASDVVRRWFTPDFLEREPDTVAHMQQMLAATNSDGYAACCEAIRDMDQREEVAHINVPTLIISGTEDPVTPPREGAMLANAIKGARHEQLRASHLSNVERPHDFTQSLISFLEDDNG
jgi:3-oxoadipate enol-lactonase